MTAFLWVCFWTPFCSIYFYVHFYTSALSLHNHIVLTTVALWQILKPSSERPVASLLHFMNFLTTLFSLPFQINFRDSLSISIKFYPRILIRITLNLQIISILTHQPSNINLSLHLFRFFLLPAFCSFQCVSPNHVFLNFIPKCFMFG